MKVKVLVERYIESAEEVFQQIGKGKSLQERRAEKVLDYAKRYLKDSKYYRDQRRFETALASIAYCEGLLDALKLLEMVEFQWSSKNR